MSKARLLQEERRKEVAGAIQAATALVAVDGGGSGRARDSSGIFDGAPSNGDGMDLDGVRNNFGRPRAKRDRVRIAGGKR